MSVWKNASKSKARSHKERSQPAERAHLGLLEKKKDYRERALDHNQRKNTLKLLERKALNRNPDEFYFNMVKTEKKDGVHQLRETALPETTEDQLKLMFSQDQKYVNMKRAAEMKKIEKLKSSLHLIDSNDKPKNKHTIFVDSKKEVLKFDAAKHFQTHPSLLSRQYNRPTLESLRRGDFKGVDEEALQVVSKKKKEKYQELKKRIEREKQLAIIAQKMERKKQLLKEKNVKKTQISEETKDAPAQYKWVFKRKR